MPIGFNTLNHLDTMPIGLLLLWIARYHVYRLLTFESPRDHVHSLAFFFIQAYIEVMPIESQ